MPSATYIILDYVCPSIGVVLATMTFAAPVTSLRHAIAEGSLGDLNPTPWAFMIGNCMGWVAYSYLTKDIFVLFANVPGLMVSIWLNLGAVKLQYREHFDERIRDGALVGSTVSDHFAATTTGGGLDAKARRGGRSNGDDGSDDNDDDSAEIDFVAPSTVPHERKLLRILFLWVAIFSGVAHVNMTRQIREKIIGVIVNVNLTFFYGAPLSTIAEVLRVRSSASLHVWTVAMMVTNAFFWLVYGLAVLDPFIYVPNGIGFVLGLLQTSLLCVFPSKERRQQMLTDGDGNDLSEGLMNADEADDIQNEPGTRMADGTNF